MPRNGDRATQAIVSGTPPQPITIAGSTPATSPAKPPNAAPTAKVGARSWPITARACDPCTMDLEVSPALTIPADELGWRFSRSSGAGGQHVNTSDTRVELSWSVAGSLVLSEQQRALLTTRLAGRLVSGVLTVTASERRSQLRNRETALEKLGALVRAALAPAGPRRRATKPTRGSARRHLAAKQQRSATKRQRQRPSGE
jgi:ribosome-associated protein